MKSLTKKKIFKRKIEKLQNRKIFDAKQEFKIVDAGDSLALILPKSQIDQMLSEQIKFLQTMIHPLEVMQRFMHRYLSNSKK